MKQSFFASIVLQPVSTVSTYRVSGFSSLGGDGLSFVQYIGVITSFFICTRNDMSPRSKRRYGLMCFWIFLYSYTSWQNWSRSFINIHPIIFIFSKKFI